VEFKTIPLQTKSQIRTGGWELLMPSGASQAGMNISPYYATVRALANSVAAQCIRLVAKSMAMAKLKAYHVEKGKWTEIEEHWLNDLMDRPNGWMSENDLWDFSAVCLNTGGAFFWELRRQDNRLGGPVVEVKPIPPHQMEILVNADGDVVGYIYTPIEGERRELSVDEVLRVDYPNPLDPSRPYNPLASAYREMGMDNEASRFLEEFFQNNAMPTLVLSTDQAISAKQAQQEEERWYAKVGRRMRQFLGTVVLGHGVKPIPIQPNFKDMEFTALRELTETRICAAFGVDPVLLPTGTGIKEGTVKANAEEAYRRLWNVTIIPILKKIESKINRELLYAEKNVRCRFDLSDIDVLKEDINQKFERAVLAFKEGVFTRDQALTEMGHDTVGGEAGAAYVFEAQANMFKAQAELKQAMGQPVGKPERQEQEQKAIHPEGQLDQLTQALMKAQDEMEERITQEVSDFF